MLKNIPQSPPIWIIVAMILCTIIGMIALDRIGRLDLPPPTPTDPYAGVLPVRMSNGSGSCFVVAQRDSWWYAITARHIAPRIGTDLAVDEEYYSAEVVRISSHEDIVLIRFQSPETYPIYTFAEPVVGADCITVGWSGGSRLLYKGNIVSLDLDDFVVANSGVFPGCSGGALFDPSHQVLGITVAFYSGFDSSALYVPAKYAKAMVITIGN